MCRSIEMSRWGEALGSLWWCLQVHACGIWKMGPGGYQAHRRRWKQVLVQLDARLAAGLPLSEEDLVD